MSRRKPKNPSIDWSSPIARGLQMDYLLDEGGGLSIRDLVTRDKISVVNSDWLHQYGDIGLRFDASGEYALRSNIPTFQKLNVRMSFEFEFTQDSDGTGTTSGTLISEGESATFGGRIWEIENNASNGLTFQIWWNSVPGIWAFTKPAAGKKHHMVIVYDASSTSNDPIIYVDGVKQTLNETASPSGSLRTNTTYLTFGENPERNAAWDGNLYRFRKWNRLLGQREVEQLYSNPYLIYNQHVSLGKSLAAAVTVSPDVLSATFSLITPSVSGGVSADNAVDFNGSSQWGLVPNYDAMEIGGTGTIEGWVYLDNESRDTYGGPFSIVTPGGDIGALIVEDSNNRGIVGERRYSGSHATTITANNLLPFSTWTHLAAVFENGVVTKVFVDGVQITSGFVFGPQTPAGTATSTDGMQFAIARLSSTTTNRWNGRVACTRLWSVVRTETEIATNKDFYLDPSLETGLVLNLNFSEGTGTTADNDASAGNDLVLTGTPSWTTGPSLSSKSYGGAVSVSATVLSVLFALISPSVSGNIPTTDVFPNALPLVLTLNNPIVVAATVGRYVEKFFVYKVYSQDGSFITNWSNDVISEPRITSAINAGPGELVIRLARSFENFGEDGDVAFSNRVDCWGYDVDSPGGILLYRGFISTYIPVLDEGKEFLQITLLPNISVASKIMLRETNEDTTVPFLSSDPSDIFRGIISRAVADGLDIETTANSIDDTGTIVSYTFNTNTVKEALDKAIELAPDGWYWRVDPDNTFHLHEKVSTINHDLLIGKHIKTMRPEKRIENIINRVYVTGGGSPPLYRVYSRQSSIDAYGLRAVKIVDQRITLAATAQTLAERILNESQSPEVRVKMTIDDNNGKTNEAGYDIESVKVGDTVRIKNLQYGQKSESLWDVMIWDVDVWDQTLASIAGSALLVVKTSYLGGNSLEIETSSRFPVVSKRIEDINRNLEDTQTVDNPTAPS